MAIRTRTRSVAPAIKPAPNVGLSLFVSADSLPSDWARLVLAEKDVDGTAVQFIKPGEVNEDFIVLNPAQTLPTLADREGVIQTARVIVEYLDERYPHPSMMPQEPAGRARVRMTLHRIEHELFPLASALGHGGAEATAAKRSLIDGLRSGARFFPSRGYFLGPEYTLADSAWAVLLRRLHTAGVTLPPEAASVRAYGERLFARPGFQRCFNGVAATPRRKT